ncbi:MAG: hypothetical protein JO368_01430 [Acidimicrobiales bacterium]|nr:hypothetical protein [Acidimicrobiales bacterium]
MVRLRSLRAAMAAAVVVVVLSPIGATVATVATGTTSAGAATTPACTFNGSALPIVTGATAGEQIKVACTGLPPLHPYLTLETSLLLGIDPRAKPLLDGQIVSLQGLQALLAALPEINPLALSLELSDLSGNLDFTYTLPSTRPLDPNAVCPPTTPQINSGLIGCGLATIDLTAFKPVGPASSVIEYSGDPLFPPAPTLALGASTTTTGSTVTVADAPGATTFWWLSTLLALESLLGGGTPPTPVVTVTLTKGAKSVTAPNTITVAPASYDGSTLTPPRISGSFTVPPKIRGKTTVAVTYGATLLGFPLSNAASAPLTVKP